MKTKYENAQKMHKNFELNYLICEKEENKFN